MRIAIRAFLRAAALLLLAVAAGRGEPSALPPLRVGVTANYPPIIFKKGRAYAGVEAAFAERLAAQLRAQLKFVEMPFDKLLSALNAGKIDIIMSGMTVTATREPLARFCNPYATTGQALMVRREDLWTFSYPEVIYLIKTRVGVEKGTIADLLAQRRCPNAKISTYPSPEAAFKALRKKDVDVVMADAPVIWQIAAAEQGGDLVAVPKLLTQENLAWAVRRDDTELLNAANDILARWRADGTLAEILRTYLPLAK